MKSFAIITDSTVDLNPEQHKLINSTIAPLFVNLGEHSFLDLIELDGEGLYNKIDELKLFPKTGAANPELFTKLYVDLKKQGYSNILVLGIGSAFSTTSQSARIAAEEAKGVHVRVVESHTLSSGTGLLALRAHELREEGKSLDEVADYLESISPKIRAQFIVDNLDMLAAGGRVNGIKLFLGRIFKAHPFLQINDDKLAVVSTPKGKSVKALDEMLDVARKEIGEGLENPHVFITHSFGEERVDYILENLTKFVKREDISITKAGSVISSHCGKGTIGILYIRK